MVGRRVGCIAVLALALCGRAIADDLAAQFDQRPSLTIKVGPGRITIAGVSITSADAGISTPDYANGNIATESLAINWWPGRVNDETPKPGTKRVQCGYRVVELESDDKRVIASFACKPEPEEESAVEHGIAISAPGWKRIAIGSELELAGSNGTTLWTRRSFDRTTPLPDVVRRVMVARGLSPTLKARKRGDKVMLTGTATARIAANVTLAWRCSDGSVAIVGIIGAAIDDGDLAIAATGRCLGSKEAMPSYR